MTGMRALIVDYCGVLDGAEEDRRRWRKVLTAAKDAGYGTAILSNDPGGSRRRPDPQLAGGRLRGYGSLLSGEVGVDKPDPRIFRITAERLDVAVKDCILIDDSILNIKGAVESGLIGVYYQQFDRAIVEITGLLGLEGTF
jgi:FMN phosphatase YigB (HAD superfamily)